MIKFKGDPAQQRRLMDEFDTVIDHRLMSLLLGLAWWGERTIGKDMVVTCLLRTPTENEAVNGTKQSAHLDGRAADLRTFHLTEAEIAQIIAHLNEKWGTGYLYVLHHDSGSGDHLHVNIKYAHKAPPT